MLTLLGFCNTAPWLVVLPEPPNKPVRDHNEWNSFPAEARHTFMLTLLGFCNLATWTVVLLLAPAYILHTTCERAQATKHDFQFVKV